MDSSLHLCAVLLSFYISMSTMAPVKVVVRAFRKRLFRPRLFGTQKRFPARFYLPLIAFCFTTSFLVTFLLNSLRMPMADMHTQQDEELPCLGVE